MIPDDDDDVGSGANPDLPDAADPAKTKKRQISQKLKEEQNRNWWMAALGDEVGRRCLWNVLTSARTFEEPFAITGTGFPHHEATWFIAGKQKIGLDLYHTWLRLDPLAVSAMHRENDPRFIQTKEIR
jgi:hypothetical protein